MKRTYFGIAVLSVSVLLGALLTAAAPAQTPPVISPDVHADKSVTFRFRAPNDKEVAVIVEGATKPLAMQKDDQGVWSVTTEPLAPDYYGYTIIADGVGLFDPSNHTVKPNFLVRASELHVPGPASLPWEIGTVPHGEIHHHFYKSGVVGDDRDYYVYTPPGYDARGKQTYPVLYLLHGFSDDASAWTAVGRANVILDNLIAQGKAKPMLVVMPLGYGAPEVLLPNSGVWRDPAITQRNFDKFREALLTEVIPRVEGEYLAAKDRNSRAIAGLSMGGAMTLLAAFNNLDKFAWVGTFSAGLPPIPGVGVPINPPPPYAASLRGPDINNTINKEKLAALLPQLDASANAKLRLYYVGIGSEDGLITAHNAYKELLKQKGVNAVIVETHGYGHEWAFWRIALHDFAPRLFKPQTK